MPGLLRGIVRTAAVSGTATAVSNRVSRRQAERWAEQDVDLYRQQESFAAAPSRADPIELLKELGALRQQGILTDQEFAAQKAKILGS